MKKRVIDLRQQTPLLDLISYGRGGRELTPAQLAYVARTVRRVPEVVVKVSGGARTLAGVERHMKYIEKRFGR
jgi:deoxyribose-phosphate aldolase